MMPYSVGSTTVTTPSPADRQARSFSSIGPSSRRALSAGSPATPHSAYGSAFSTPARVTPSTSTNTDTTSNAVTSTNTASKSVRFSPAYSSSFQPSFTPTSAPPTRLQGPVQPSPATPNNSLLFRSPSAPAGLSLSSVTPQRSTSAPASPISAPTSKVHAHKPVAVTHLPPMGRGVVARRLRVNSVMLVFWWLSSRTNLYGFASGHLVQIIPSLDTPLHVLESGLLLLLFYNICDSMYKLNELASISPSSAPPTKRTSPTSSPFASPVAYSSPKTRSSPSVSTSPSISRFQSPGSPVSPFRQSVRSSSNPPTPQTPSSVPRVSTALRRSTLAGSPSPSPSSGAGVSGLGLGGMDGEPSSIVKAYYARHSPDFKSSLSSSVSSRKDIERLLMD